MAAAAGTSPADRGVKGIPLAGVRSNDCSYAPSGAYRGLRHGSPGLRPGLLSAPPFRGRVRGDETSFMPQNHCVSADGCVQSQWPEPKSEIPERLRQLRHIWGATALLRLTRLLFRCYPEAENGNAHNPRELLRVVLENLLGNAWKLRRAPIANKTADRNRAASGP